MSTLETSLDPRQRLQRIRFAMWNRRWWEARGLLADAQAHGDWKVLGHTSWEDYLEMAYHVRGRPRRSRV
jgi:hypothetical protein